MRRCRQLMEVLPSFRWLKVFSQPWEGDVTMVLPSTYMQIKKSITNPSIDDLKLASLQVGFLCVCLSITLTMSSYSGIQMLGLEWLVGSLGC